MKIVLLFEGTENEPDKKPSVISELKYKYNIKDGIRVKSGECLVNDVSKGQLVNLVMGSGTTGWCRKLHAGVGTDSWKKVFEQYDWLVNAIKKNSLNIPDVRLFVFGFSRGAYQALMFANVLDKVGIDSRIRSRRDLYAEYRRNLGSQGKCSVKIEYLGLIDTVEAAAELQIPVRRIQGLYTSIYRKCCKWAKIKYLIPRNVIRWRHALALNEYRSRFTPEVFNGTQDQELWFMGAHADVGKGYNGKICKGSGGRDPSQVYTKLFGNCVIAWLLDPVSQILQFHGGCPCEWQSNSVPTFDYVNLMSLFPFLIHDSYNEVSNWRGVTSYRSQRQFAHYHHSAAGVWHLLRMSMFPHIAVKVEKLEYRPKNPVTKSLTLQQGMLDLLDSQKVGDVWAPVLDSDRRKAREELREFYRIIFSKYMHGYMSAYKELFQKGVHSNAWPDEVRAVHDFYVPQLWKCFFGR